MHPYGFLGLSPFLLVIPLVVVVGTAVLILGAKRASIPWRRILRLPAALSMVALFGARGFSVLLDHV